MKSEKETIYDYATELKLSLIHIYKTHYHRHTDHPDKGRNGCGIMAQPLKQIDSFTEKVHGYQNNDIY